MDVMGSFRRQMHKLAMEQEDRKVVEMIQRNTLLFALQDLIEEDNATVDKLAARVMDIMTSSDIVDSLKSGRTRKRLKWFNRK